HWALSLSQSGLVDGWEPAPLDSASGCSDIGLSEGCEAEGWVIAAEPASPFSPLGPGSPFSPWSPFSPLGPIGPGGPAGPAAPIAPVGPAGPGSPAGPRGPAGPAAPTLPRARQDHLHRLSLEGRNDPHDPVVR